METIENNKLIAEFMGFKIEPFENDGGSGFAVWLNGVPNNLKGFSCAKYGTLQLNIDTVCSFMGINYATSWDWLMHVVENIESLNFNEYTGFTVDIRRKFCCIYCHENNRQDGVIYQSQYGKDYPTKISAVYEAVVQFIQFYNQTKQL